MSPLIIEAAINGITPKARNQNVPISPEEIEADAMASLLAGAAIVHSHIEGFALQGEAAAASYMAGWRNLLQSRPDALLYPTVAAGNTPEQRFGHFALLARQGVRMAAFDPGSVNLAAAGRDGLPGKLQLVYTNSFADIAALAEMLTQARVAPSIAIYEPGFLRATLAWHRAGKLPAGAFVKFYFGGPCNMLDGRPGNVTFGLPPTATALAAYLEMMEGCDLPWAVSVLGGDVTALGLARLAIERGGHVRVGLEDFAGDRVPANAELVAEVVALAERAGRQVASCAQAADILALPPL